MRPAHSAAAWAIHYADRAKGAQKDAEAAKAAHKHEDAEILQGVANAYAELCAASNREAWAAAHNNPEPEQ